MRRAPNLRTCMRAAFGATLGGIGIVAVNTRSTAPLPPLRNLAWNDVTDRDVQLVPLGTGAYLDEHERQRRALGGPEEGSALAPEKEERPILQVRRKKRTKKTKAEVPYDPELYPADAERAKQMHQAALNQDRFKGNLKADREHTPAKGPSHVGAAEHDRRDDAPESVGERFHEAVESVKKKAHELSERVTGRAEEAKETVMDKARHGKQIAEGRMEDAVDAAKEKARETMDTAKERAEELKERGKRTMHRAKEGVREKAGEALDAFETTGHQTADMARDMARDAKRTTKGAIRGAKEEVEEGAEDLARKARQRTEDAKDSASHMMEDLKEGVRGSMHVMRDKGREAMHSARKATKRGVEKALIAASPLYSEEDYERQLIEEREAAESAARAQRERERMQRAMEADAASREQGDWDAGEETDTPSHMENVPGGKIDLRRKLLQGGTYWTQSFAPLRAIHSHLCDFNFVSGDIRRAVEGHKYCSYLNSDVTQCLIYEENRPDARLTGVEYVISRELFDALPPEEQRLWHSKAYQVKSGMTIAPGVPPALENPIMKDWANCYGKTWYTWQVDKGDVLPLGQPLLMMSYTKDGQYPVEMLRKRDAKDWLVYRSKDRRMERLRLDIKKPSPQADMWQASSAVQTSLQEINSPTSGDRAC